MIHGDAALLGFFLLPLRNNIRDGEEDRYGGFL
jgi:hypothetical protein